MSSTETQPLLVDEVHAAEILGGLSGKTLYRLRKIGELPYVMIGCRVMYSPADLAEWVQRKKTKPANAEVSHG